MGTLDGRGVLVTGWSRGIGRAIVTRLAGDGASVVFSYLQDQDCFSPEPTLG
jgi:3-oxoacyl-[acyl-carrier protein] reductase